MTIQEYILVIMGVLLIIFSLFMIHKGDTDSGHNITIRILGNEVVLNTPVILVLVFGVLLLFSPTINNFVSPSSISVTDVLNSNELDKYVTDKFDNKVKKLVETVDSGYSKVIFFEDGGVRSAADKTLLFYAEKGQEVILNVVAPYSTVDRDAYLTVTLNNEHLKTYKLQGRQGLELDISDDMKKRSDNFHVLNFDVVDQVNRPYFSKDPLEGNRGVTVESFVLIKKKRT